ncbi:hypothetical protein ACJX0J_040836, partial [Zea mays]
ISNKEKKKKSNFVLAHPLYFCFSSFFLAAMLWVRASLIIEINNKNNIWNRMDAFL